MPVVMPIQSFPYQHLSRSDTWRCPIFNDTDATIVVHPLSVFLQSVILGDIHDVANFAIIERYLSDIMMVRHNLTLQQTVCGARFGHMHHSILRAKLQIIFRIIIILRHYNSSQHFKSKKIRVTRNSGQNPALLPKLCH